MKSFLLIDYDRPWMRDIYDGVPLSDKGVELFCQKIGVDANISITCDLREYVTIRRDSRILIEVFNELGNDALIEGARGFIVVVPDGENMSIGIGMDGKEFIYDRRYSYRMPL